MQPSKKQIGRRAAQPPSPVETTAQNAAATQLKKQTTSRRRTAILFGALVLLAIVFIATNGPGRIATSMAQSALQSGNFESAQWWLTETSVFKPVDAHSDYLRARLARKQGDLPLMGSHLKAALRKGYDTKFLEREQTLALVSLGQLTPSVEQQLTSWTLEPDADLADILDAYVNGLTATSRFEDAFSMLNLWEEKLPNDPTPNYRRGRIEEHLARFAQASAEYRKTIDKDEHHFKARYSLARLLNLERRPEEALTLFKSCDVGITSAAARIGMAQCYKALGETEKAQTLLKEVIALEPNVIDQSYKAVDENPERSMCASELGCIEAELGNFKDAKRYLEMALAAYPRDSIARYSYAVTLRGLGMSKESEENFEITRQARAALDQITVLKEKLRTNSQDSDVRIQIGKIVLEHESESAGVYWIESVFSYDLNNQAAHQALVDYYESQPGGVEQSKQRLDYHRSFLTKK